MFSKRIVKIMTLKTISLLLPAAAISLLTHNLLAQGVDPWVTIDAYHTVDQPVTESASSGDITISPVTGQFYSVGGAGRDQEGNWVATIRGSLMGENDWTTLDTYSVAGWPWSHFRGVASDSFGRVFAGGELYNSVGPEKAWIVRESADGGQTWVTADFFRLAAHSGQSCADIKVSPSGDVYAVGFASDSANWSWIVRKRGFGQTTFSTVDSVGNGMHSASAIAFHPAGVFVAGNLTTSGRSVWTVRKSPTGASGTW